MKDLEASLKVLVKTAKKDLKQFPVFLGPYEKSALRSLLQKLKPLIQKIEEAAGETSKKVELATKALSIQFIIYAFLNMAAQATETHEKLLKNDKNFQYARGFLSEILDEDVNTLFFSHPCLKKLYEKEDEQRASLQDTPGPIATVQPTLIKQARKSTFFIGAKHPTSPNEPVQLHLAQQRDRETIAKLPPPSQSVNLENLQTELENLLTNFGVKLEHKAKSVHNILNGLDTFLNNIQKIEPKNLQQIKNLHLLLTSIIKIDKLPAGKIMPTKCAFAMLKSKINIIIKTLEPITAGEFEQRHKPTAQASRTYGKSPRPRQS